MTPQHFRAPAAIQAHDVIGPNRLAKRDSGYPGTGIFRLGFARTGERLMKRRDPGGHLVDTNLIAPDICSHNARGEFPHGPSCRLLVTHTNSSAPQTVSSRS